MTTVALSGTPHIIVWFGGIVFDQLFWYRRRQELNISLPGQCLLSEELTPVELAERVGDYLAAAPKGLRDRCRNFADALHGSLSSQDEPQEMMVSLIERHAKTYSGLAEVPAPL